MSQVANGFFYSDQSLAVTNYLYIHHLQSRTRGGGEGFEGLIEPPPPPPPPRLGSPTHIMLYSDHYQLIKGLESIRGMNFLHQL